MLQAPLLKPEVMEYVAARYMTGATPRELVVELKTEFKVEVTAAALRQTISRRGLGRRRRAVDESVCKLVPAKAAAKIADARAEKPAERIAGWTEQLGAVADKTLAVAVKSNRLKDVSVAMTTASAAIKAYRLCAGLDRGSGAAAASFNFNFCNGSPVSVTVAPAPSQPVAQAIEVQVTGVPDLPKSVS